MRGLRKTGSFVGPITGLSVSDVDGMVLVGSGGQVFVYAANGAALSNHAIFDAHSIHGIKASCGKKRGEWLVFGDKAVAVILVEVEEGCNTKVIVQCSLSKLDDLVLDCHAEEEWLLVGHAHNFVDFYRRGQELSHVSRVQGADICVLFSLSFAPQCGSEDMLVASGTALGKVILWLAPRPQTSTTAVTQDRGRNLHTLSSHEGVIFRLTWAPTYALSSSSPALPSLLASVSDDRTVRVWGLEVDGHRDIASVKELFVGWGHLSRLWDCVFLDPRRLLGCAPSHAAVVATSSEDGTVKLWRVCLLPASDSSSSSSSGGGECMFTLRGHSHHIWRLAAVRGGSHIITGGNEGAVRAWNLRAQLGRATAAPGAASGESSSSSSSSLTLSIPNFAPSEDEQLSSKPQSRRNNGVSALRVAPDGSAIILATIDGCVWLISLLNTDSGVEGSWQPIERLAASVMNMDCRFSLPQQQGFVITIILAHPQGRITQLLLQGQEAAGVSDRAADPALFGSRKWEVVRRGQWAGHSTNLVNLWFVPVPAPLPFERAGENEELRCLALSASIKGQCKLWLVDADATTSSSSSGSGGGDCGAPRLFGELHSLKGEIASACAAWAQPQPQPQSQDSGLSKGDEEQEQEQEEKKGRFFLAVGDSRGSLSIFSCRPTQAQGQLSFVAAAFLFHLHALEPVQSLLPLPSGLLSAGNDGTLAALRLHYFHSAGTDAGAGAGEEAEAGAGLVVEIVSVSACLPVRTPDSLSLAPASVPASLAPSCPPSLFVAGYHANEALVCDVQFPYQVLRVDGGGRRRPHHSATCGAGSVFACPVVQGTGTALRIDVHMAPSDHFQSRGENGDGEREGENEKEAAIHLPQHLILGGLPRVLYAGTFLGDTGLLAVGGEDGEVRVVAATTLAPRQTLHMPGHTSVKTLCAAASAPAPAPAAASGGTAGGGAGQAVPAIGGLLLAAGGRLAYSLWTWTAGSSDCRGGGEGGGEGRAWDVAPLGPLRFELAGSLLSSAKNRAGAGAGAEQDHRILSSAVLALPATSLLSFFFVLCDSRGSATVGAVAILPRRMGVPAAAAPATDAEEGGKEPPVLHTGSSVSLLSSLPASEYPLLSCCLLPLPSSSSRHEGQGRGEGHTEVLAAFGDSSGVVGLWLLRLGPGPSEAGAEKGALKAAFWPLASFVSHSVGANCTWGRVFPPLQPSASPSEAEAEQGQQTDLLVWVDIVSGGDDQALTVLRGALQFSAEAEARTEEGSSSGCGWAWVKGKQRQQTRQGAAGAAIQSVVAVAESKDGAATLLALACDQRLTAWSLPASRADAALAFLHGIVVNVGDVADLAVAATNEGALLAVVGEGVQLVESWSRE